MHHPETDNQAPWGYSVHWQAATRPQVAPVPWGRVALICLGCAVFSGATGFLIASRISSGQVEEAQQIKAEAEQIKASASGDLEIARAKVAEQQQRLRLVNDCVYEALNMPVPTPIPSPSP